MPVQNDAPTGIVVWDEWGLWGAAASKLAAVAANDGDTSVIYAASGGRGVYQTFTFPFLGGIGDPVNAASVTAVTRHYAHGAGHNYYVFFARFAEAVIGADFDFGPTVEAGGGGYVNCTSNAAGAQLSAANVNGPHTLGFHGAGGPGNKAEFWVTQFYRTVDYGFGSSGSADPFTHLVASIAGAFIGSNLLLREIPKLSAFMRTRAQKWLRPDEYETAWRAWREQKRMVAA
jgi:hypothetical protein